MVWLLLITYCYFFFTIQAVKAMAEDSKRRWRRHRWRKLRDS